MHAIHARIHPQRRRRPVSAGPFPWEEAHAAPEDRAMGLELELIELVARRRSIADAAAPEALALDREIDQLRTELQALSPSLPLAG